jgi:hypothetical protein
LTGPAARDRSTRCPGRGRPSTLARNGVIAGIGTFDASLSKPGFEFIPQRVNLMADDPLADIENDRRASSPPCGRFKRSRKYLKKNNNFQARR